MRAYRSRVSIYLYFVLMTASIEAIILDLTSSESIKSAASSIAYDMMLYYNGNMTGGVPGLLPPPYYWWQAGAMMGSLIDYWHLTGDSSYNTVVYDALLFQTGDDHNYMPPNQTTTEGNDDQCFWALAVMSATETNFQNPPSTKAQWLSLAQAVFNMQAARWDNATCGGGLKWQIFPFNNGFHYKNSISNGCFFNLASRLARYTGDQLYADWAVKIWEWTEAVGLMDDEYFVYDGSDSLINCTSINRLQYSYNPGIFLLGAANMYNITNSSLWKLRVEGLLNSTHIFFKDDIMYEAICEPIGRCNVDQHSFKAYLSRWMAATTKMAPFTLEAVREKLQSSAQAASEQCIGGDNGRTCGFKWTEGPVWDGTFGVGHQMCALEVIQNVLAFDSPSQIPLTNLTGGTSTGNPTAGIGTEIILDSRLKSVSTGDRAGAGFLTVILVIGFLTLIWLMNSGSYKNDDIELKRRSN